MENSKTLIVIVSVSLFVAAVLGLGLVLFYPRATPQVAQTGEQAGTSDGFDAIEYLRDGDAERPSLEVEEDTEDRDDEDEVVIVYGESVEERAREPREARDDAEVDEAREERARTERSSTGDEEREAQQTREPQEPAPQPESTPEVQEESATPARAAPRPEAETRTVEVTEYWIQVIATTSRDRIDRARDRLGEHQLKGRVTTTKVEGRTFYRLRVGPYTNKNEADKFLDWVNDIEGFGDSYISEEYATRTVSG